MELLDISVNDTHVLVRLVTRPCPADYVCLPGLGDNPNFGFTNFDTFPWSMLTTFQLITLDYWENIYNMVLTWLRDCIPFFVLWVANEPPFLN